MSIPLMIDSDDADSLEVSQDTIVCTDVPDIRVAHDINPDNIDVDLYLDEALFMDQEHEQEQEQDQEQEQPKPEPMAVTRTKATTIQSLEDELVDCVSQDCSIFHTLYILHEHFSKSKTTTANEKAVVKGRILNKLSGKISGEKVDEFRKVLNNFFQ